jgi:proteasome lid subunit RPN8/RPN11
MDYLKLLEDMNNHALRDYPRECVGIITKDFTYIPCKNLSDNPKQTFFLDPAALVQHDGNIWGIFHSHPGSDNPLPSSEDKVSAAFSEYKFLVGFNNKFYIYWYDKNVDALKFEKVEEKHFVSNN